MISPSSTAEQRLLKLIVEKSYLESDVPKFRLASGGMSKFYIDCKKVLSYPEARLLIGELIYDRIRELQLDAVGGLALGAYPLALTVSDAIYRHDQRTVRVFVVRKEAKGHGLKKHVEGDIKQGDKALVVEDVVTMGQSTLEAVSKSREEGLEIVKIIALIDRQEGGRENIESQGIPFETLFTRTDLQNFKPST